MRCTTSQDLQDMNPYQANSLKGGDSTQSTIRFARIKRAAMRTAKSPQYFVNISKDLVEMLSEDIYGIGSDNIPHGCDKESILLDIIQEVISHHQTLSRQWGGELLLGDHFGAPYALQGRQKNDALRAIIQQVLAKDRRLAINQVDLHNSPKSIADGYAIANHRSIGNDPKVTRRASGAASHLSLRGTVENILKNLDVLNDSTLSVGSFYVMPDDFYTRLSMAYRENNLSNMQDLLFELYQIRFQQQRDNLRTMSLELEAVIIQLLIRLGRFEEAQEKINAVLSRFPHDDFINYCQIEVLIQRPAGIWFFGPRKQDDLKLAHDLLMCFGAAGDAVPIYQTKHWSVWSKYHHKKVQLEDNQEKQDQHAKMAEILSKKIPKSSSYYHDVIQFMGEHECCADEPLCFP